MNVFYDPLEAACAIQGTIGQPAATPLTTSFVALRHQQSCEGPPMKERVRRLLYTVHGRDKIFKAVQYGLRLYLWASGTTVVSRFLPTESFSDAQRTWMTITNTRRMFKVGRFVAEIARAAQTFKRIAALAYAPGAAETSARVLVTLQLQMVLDILARLVMCTKSSLDDICWASRKGFLHAAVEGRYAHLATLLGVPVLLADLALNTMHLVQGVQDAAALAAAPHSLQATSHHERLSYSLITAYSEMERRQRRSREGSETPSPTSAAPSIASLPSDRTVETRVKTVARLLWYDEDLRWATAFEVKLILDVTVAILYTLRASSRGAEGVLATFGMASAMVSLRRVWQIGK